MFDAFLGAQSFFSAKTFIVSLCKKRFFLRKKFVSKTLSLNILVEDNVSKKKEDFNYILKLVIDFFFKGVSWH